MWGVLYSFIVQRKWPQSGSLGFSNWDEMVTGLFWKYLSSLLKFDCNSKKFEVEKTTCWSRNMNNLTVWPSFVQPFERCHGNKVWISSSLLNYCDILMSFNSTVAKEILFNLILSAPSVCTLPPGLNYAGGGNIPPPLFCLTHSLTPHLYFICPVSPFSSIYLSEPFPFSFSRSRGHVCLTGDLQLWQVAPL